MRHFFLLLILISGTVNAQNFTLRWENDVNLNAGVDDYGIHVVSDASGNHYTAGYRGTRSVVRKYSSTGTLLWSQDFLLGSGAAYGPTTPVKVGVDNSGNVYLIAQCAESGIMKRLISKYNSSGTQIFAQVFGSTSSLHTTDAWVDPTGIVYACGYIDGGSGAIDAEVSKYTNAGVQTWQRTYDATFTIDDERAQSLHVDGSNNVYITGKARTSLADPSLLVIKYNSAGTQQWVHTYAQNFGGVDRLTQGTSITTDASLNVYISGYFTTSSSTDYHFLRKLNSAGTVQWSTASTTGIFGTTKSYGQDIYISGTEIQVVGTMVSGASSGTTFTQEFNSTTGNALAGVSHNALSGFFALQPKKFVRNVDGTKTKSFVSNDVIRFWNGSTWENHIASPTGFPAFAWAVINSNEFITATGCKQVSSTDRSHYVVTWCRKPFINSLPASVSGCTYTDVQIPTASIPGGSSVAWTPSTGLSNPNIINPIALATTNGTTFTLTVTNSGGCQNTQDILVARIPDPSKNIRVNGTVVSTGCGCTVANTYTVNGCPGDVIELTGTNSNYCYSWYKDNTSNFLGLTCGLDPITVNSSGLYFAEVSYNPASPGNPPSYQSSGCTILSFNVEVNLNAVSIELGPNQSICAGSNAIITAPSGFTSYLWNTGATTQSIFPTTAGTYSVVGTYGSGCTATDQVTVTVNNLPAIELGPTIQSCAGQSININAGSGYSSYIWNTGSTASNINVTSDGNYSVQVTDANGCTNSDMVAVIFNSLPTVGFTVNSTAAICNGQSAFLEFFGGDSYTLSPPGTSTTNSSLNTTPTTTTLYTLTGTVSSTGCQNTSQFTVTVNNGPGIDAIATPATCGSNNGSASVNILSGSGPFTYLWNTGATSSSISSLAAGHYNVTVTAGNGCTSTQSVSVSNTGGPSVLISPVNVNCSGGNNGSASANPTGGTLPYSFLWSTGATTSTITGLTEGTYTVTVTDGAGCQTIENTLVGFNNPLPSVGITGNSILCFGNTTTLNASGASSYLWSTGASGSSINVSPTGDEIITVTGTDGNGCQNTAQINIIVNENPTATVNESNASCGQSDGQATVTPANGQAPYSVLWSNGQSSLLATGLSAGTYFVTVADFNGCTATSSAIIQNTNGPAVNVITGNTTCEGGNNGSATANVTGGTAPYQYNWSNGATTSSASGLSSGNYSVEITDDAGCTVTENVVIGFDHALPQINLGADTTICDDATLILDAGNGFSTYTWNTGAQTAQIAVTSAGIYSVSITDNNGCTNSDAINVAVEICTGIEEQYGLSVRMYPNPIHDGILVIESDRTIDRFEVWDACGKVLYSENANNSIIRINSQTLSPGWYLIRLQSGSHIQIEQLIKQ